ncbi:putative glucose-methanol-choline (gmc) oxidoreductase [Sclerotinia borealis F-4128]|uniref:Putative glucose-methanol-choline (Gmc) oxidoreductase n=1 Tax=Sclerotinia borealis (strain F-4128) TaxID=1432307 RepID=W9CAA7_SCLBF|nr:putative glucose-methanol-choline (gmc) oxidoreductase [Sclerotinia borealis F-4128]
MFSKDFTALGLAALSLVSQSQAGPTLSSSHLKARSLLGNSFGVPGRNATYDYVVVGGGNAGLTIAMRLAEAEAGSVAVIEAGTFYEISNGNISQVPSSDGIFAGKGATDWQPQIDWGYQTTPQSGAFNTSLHYARGKTLGGCSARNFMVYQRGTVGSMQKWADQVGDDSYEWDNFLPFYQKSVNFSAPDMTLRASNSTPDFVTTEAANTPATGPLSVTWSNYAQAFGTWAIQGLVEIGIPVIPGFLGGSLLGSSYPTFTLNADRMTRESSETSFLRVGMQSPDLKVYTLSLAKKILFDESKTATGVLVETGGYPFTLTATKEVILSAGVFGSPQLLLASGVGPAAELSALGIDVVADLPGVGKGMQDHVFTGIGYRVNAPTISKLGNDAAYAAEQASLFENTPAAGMYTSPDTDVLGWEKIPEKYRTEWSNETKTALAEYPADWPEVEYIAISSFLGNQVIAGTDPGDGFNYATMAIAIVAPRSRGTITITSSDTNVAPIIDPGWLTERSDVDILVGAVKRVREFYATDALQSFVIGDEYFPGSNISTDAQIEDFVRTSFNTIWHATSTCSMGPLNDTNTVVDTQARVLGVSSLRVVDAAAFPLLPPGHPMSTIYAFAEKIACDIICC